MNKSTDVIILGLVRWDSPYSSTTYSLAKELSKTRRVFYIDNPFTFKDFLSNYNSQEIQHRKEALLFGKNKLKTPLSDYPNLVCVTPPLMLPINWLPQGKTYDFFMGMNNWLVTKLIKTIIKQYHITDYIYLNVFNPFYVKKLTIKPAPKLNIYYTVDDISEAIYISKHGVEQEKRALKSADLVFATSRELEKKCKKTAKNVTYLPNAADFSLFQKTINQAFDQPTEIQNETRDIIIYIGNIKDRDDFPLLKKIAETHQDKLLLIIGPINTNEHKEFGLHEMKNVKFLGGKPIQELPKYMKFASVAIIPFKLSKLTKSIYPLKINEYLAAGLPVVSTNFSEDILEFNDVIYIAENHEDFSQKIALAIETNSTDLRAIRIQKAIKNNWKARAESFLSEVKKHTTIDN